MKRFEFRLEGMLNYQQQMLENEKNAMGRLIAEKNRMEQHKAVIREQLEVYRRKLEKAGHGGINIFDMKNYMAMIKNGTFQIEDIDRQLKILASEIEAQRQRVIAASQEVMKLEKLQEKELEEYRIAAAGEEQASVLEFISGRMVRRSVS